MAAETQSSISLSPSESLSPKLEDKALNGKHDPRELDWKATLSPAKRSCINMRNTESCVRNAVANLESLKRLITMKAEARRKSSSTQHQKKLHSPARSRADSAEGPQTGKLDSPARSSGADSELSVEGLRTGTVVERLSRLTPVKKTVLFNASTIISSVLNLLARLEHDRQHTHDALQDQVVKAKELREDLDKEDEKRLDLLVTCVQAEHERCANEIRNLQWHVRFEGVKLERVLEAQAYLAKRNDELKREVKHLTELNPQVEEKVNVEQLKLRDILRMRRETLDDLNFIKKELMELEDAHRKIHLVADSEKEKTRKRKQTYSEAADTGNAELNALQEEATVMTRRIKHAEDKFSQVQKKIHRLSTDFTLNEKQQLSIRKQVDLLNKERISLLGDVKQLETKRRDLQQDNKRELEKLEEGYSLNHKKMEEEEAQLRKAKRSRDDLDHDIETMKENIILTKWKIEDNEKSISRAYREIERLAQQLQVSILEYNHAYRSHRRVKDEYRLEKAKADQVEEGLREILDRLKMKRKDELKVKRLYENKIQAQTAHLLNLEAEYTKQEDRTTEILEEIEEQVKEKEEKVEELQSVQDERVRRLEVAKTELDEIEKEMVSVKSGLGGRKAQLTSQEKQLKDEMLVKVIASDNATEKINDLERKIEDKEKSTAMVLKLTEGVKSALEERKAEMDQAKEKFAVERENEQGWKDEFGEISEFSSNADSQHAEYLKHRYELLKRQTLGLQKSLSDNTELAISYHQLQCQFIRVKTEAMRVIRRKLELEASLRDHQQLLAFQSQVFASLEDHYQDRGDKYRSDLEEFNLQCKQGTHKLGSVGGKIETTLSLLLSFLQQQQKPKALQSVE